MKAEDLDQFREAVIQHLGLRFDDSKLDELASALGIRMKAASCSSVDAYLASLKISRPEQCALAVYLTVPETFFFRMPDHFRALAETALPQLLTTNSQRIRILSLGCASGEEAYSAAMLLHDRFGPQSNRISILGVDINPAVIAKARQGRYSEWSMRETPPEALDVHFRKHGHDFQINEDIRNMVSFEEGNLMDPSAAFWQNASYDIVFLRNVLMYFSPAAAKQVMTRVSESLVDGGYFFMGAAETLRGLSLDYHLCHTEGAFYYRRKIREHDTLEGSRAFWPATPKIALSSTPAPRAPQMDGADLTSVASGRVENVPAKRDTPNNREDRGILPVRQDLSIAMDLMRRERFAEALQALPPENAKSADAQLLRAALLANSGQLVEAGIACETLLRYDELSAGAHYVMALCSEHAGDFRGAEGHDQTAIYLDPSFAMPHLHLGILAKRSEDFAAARRELYQATLLLEREDVSRILLFGGGFGREALVELCHRELKACGGAR